MRLNSLLTESINDKGIFKAVFVAGYPGSGKTTLIKKVHDGSLPVMQVNSDIWTEYYLKHDRRAWSDIGGLVKRHSLNNVYFHLNSLLPLYVDSTGTNPTLFKNRVKILEEMGYDLKMFLIDIDIKESKRRAIKRYLEGGRKVAMDYIDQAYEQINKDMGMYKSNISNFKIIKAKDIDDTKIAKLSNEIFSFFSAPIKNEQGKKVVDFMRGKGYKYYKDIKPEEIKENGFYDLTKKLKWY